MSRVMRKPTFCICENKGADQLRSNCDDQGLCIHYMDSTLPLLSIFKISVLVQLSLCRTCSETQIVGFLMTRLKFYILGNYKGWAL